MASRSTFHWQPISTTAYFIDTPPEGERQKKRRKDEGDTVKADGASLQMGSSEYRERVRDLAGMSELEQDRVKLADQGDIIESEKVSTELDTQWHDDYQEALKVESEDLTDLYNAFDSEVEMEASWRTPQGNVRLNPYAEDVHDTPQVSAEEAKMRKQAARTYVQQAHAGERKQQDEMDTPLGRRMSRYS